MQVLLLNNVRKIGPDFQDDAHRTVSSIAICKKWTSRKLPAPFSAQKVDSGLQELTYKDRRNLEMNLTVLQTGSGVIGAIVAKTLVKIEDQCVDITKAAKEYSDPSVNIDNPREEMR